MPFYRSGPSGRGCITGECGSKGKLSSCTTSFIDQNSVPDENSRALITLASPLAGQGSGLGEASQGDQRLRPIRAAHKAGCPRGSGSAPQLWSKVPEAARGKRETTRLESAELYPKKLTLWHGLWGGSHSGTAERPIRVRGRVRGCQWLPLAAGSL